MIALATDTFIKPHIEYGSLWPILVVFGVGLRRRPGRGVRAARAALRRPVALAVAGAGRRAGRRRLRRQRPAASSATAPPAARSAPRAPIAVDGPTMFLWGLVLVFALGGVLLFAERRARGRGLGVRRPGGRAARHRGRARRRPRGLDHTEVYPLLMFAVGGMMLFPAANDLLTMFVALEVLSLPLYLLCGLARRRRLLSQEAALKYFLLGAFSSGFFLYGVALDLRLRRLDGLRRHQRGRPQRRRQPDPAARSAWACWPSACCSRSAPRRSRPGRPTSTRARPTAVTAFMAAATKVAAFGALLRLFYVAFGARPLDLAADDVGRSRSSRWSSARCSRSSQTDMKRMLAYSSVAHTGFLLTGVLGVQGARPSSHDGQITSLQAVLFYLVTYGFATLGAFAVVDAGARLRRRGVDDRALGGARQAVAGGRRRLRALPARRWPASR